MERPEPEGQHPEDENSGKKPATKGAAMPGTKETPQGEKGDDGPREHRLLPGRVEVVPKRSRDATPYQAVIGGRQVPDWGRGIPRRRCEGALGSGELFDDRQIGGCLEDRPTDEDGNAQHRGRHESSAEGRASSKHPGRNRRQREDGKQVGEWDSQREPDAELPRCHEPPSEDLARSSIPPSSNQEPQRQRDPATRKDVQVSVLGQSPGVEREGCPRHGAAFPPRPKLGGQEIGSRKGEPVREEEQQVVADQGRLCT